ncbi:MAG: anaerobic ribonucleoside-triphosphate reductase [Oscillospiraceae bacterium]
MTIDIRNGEISNSERQAYVDYISNQNPGKVIKSLAITLDGDFVDLNYELESMPFARIRRITGYLVGTMDRWNNAKSSEEKDRIKHSL